MPKYRGDSEDWLDSVDSLKRKTRPSSPTKVENLYSDDVQVNAQVTEVFPDLCQVQIQGESHRRLCTYRRSLFQRRGRFRSPVSVGDWVQVKKIGINEGVLEKIKTPKNRFQRLAPGENDEKRIHVLASNIDQLAIIASVTQPRFVPGIIDRMSIAASKFEIPFLLVVTKIDLFAQAHPSPWKYFDSTALKVIEVSVLNEQGLDELTAFLKNKVTAFVGHSGVGKTSLLRKIMNQPIGKIGSVNPSTGKGRHTTTSSVLYSWQSEWGLGTLIDTPGIREFDLVDVTPDDVVNFALTAIPKLADQSWLEWVNQVESGAISIEQTERLRGLVKIWKELKQ
jgi:ribosome biogenesis GTPase